MCIISYGLVRKHQHWVRESVTRCVILERSWVSPLLRPVWLQSMLQLLLSPLFVFKATPNITRLDSAATLPAVYHNHNGLVGSHHITGQYLVTYMLLHLRQQTQQSFSQGWQYQHDDAHSSSANLVSFCSTCRHLNLHCGWLHLAWVW